MVLWYDVFKIGGDFVHIIELTKDYAPLYRELRLQGLRENPTSFGASFEEESELPLSNFEEKILHPHRITFGAFESDELLSILTLEKSNLKKMSHISTLSGMYVHKAFRGQGISKPIMASAIMRAKELKCEQIHLSVNIENKIAKELYTSFGFEIIGMEKEIIKMTNGKYIDEYRMALYFDEWHEV